MDYVPPGGTDPLVRPDRAGLHGLRRPDAWVNPWALNEQAAAPLFRRAVELGITLWDTANVYGGGASEEIVGRAVKKHTRRGEI